MTHWIWAELPVHPELPCWLKNKTGEITLSSEQTRYNRGKGDVTCGCQYLVRTPHSCCSLTKSTAYLSRLVFFLLYGATILNISSTTPFLPKETAFTTSHKHTHKWGDIRKVETNIKWESVVFLGTYLLKREWQHFQKWMLKLKMTHSWKSKPWEPAGRAEVVCYSVGSVSLSWLWRSELQSVVPSLQTFCLNTQVLKGQLWCRD